MSFLQKIKGEKLTFHFIDFNIFCINACELGIPDFTLVASTPSVPNSPTWYTSPPIVYWYETAKTSSLANFWFNEIYPSCGWYVYSDAVNFLAFSSFAKSIPSEAPTLGINPFEAKETSLISPLKKLLEASPIISGLGLYLLLALSEGVFAGTL